MRSKYKLGIAVLAIMLTLYLPSALAMPTGADVQAGIPTTKGFFAAGTIAAQGGNQTELNATTETQTKAWQGFYGEVLGNLTLRSSSGTLYEWLGSTTGTVFASRQSSIDWTNITAQNDCTTDESLTGTGSDRVNKTFTQSNNTAFTIAGQTIATGTACTAHTYVNNVSQNAVFEEIILSSTGGVSIYATRIDADTTGFDGATHDFQMIVPETRNATTTTYYFYAELT